MEKSNREIRISAADMVNIENALIRSGTVLVSAEDGDISVREMKPIGATDYAEHYALCDEKTEDKDIEYKKIKEALYSALHDLHEDEEFKGLLSMTASEYLTEFAIGKTMLDIAEQGTEMGITAWFNKHFSEPLFESKLSDIIRREVKYAMKPDKEGFKNVNHSNTIIGDSVMKSIIEWENAVRDGNYDHNSVPKVWTIPHDLLTIYADDDDEKVMHTVLLVVDKEGVDLRNRPFGMYYYLAGYVVNGGINISSNAPFLVSHTVVVASVDDLNIPGSNTSSFTIGHFSVHEEVGKMSLIQYFTEFSKPQKS